MSTSSLPSFRRLATFLVPPIALVLLVVVGRNVTSAAPPLADVAPQTVSAQPPSAPLGTTPDAGATPATTPEVGDSGTAPPRLAIETLGDGGVIVDLNLATEDELRKLPGIGATRARAILALRARLGRFKSVDELARIKGLGRNMIKRLRPRVRVAAP